MKYIDKGTYTQLIPENKRDADFLRRHHGATENCEAWNVFNENFTSISVSPNMNADVRVGNIATE